MAHIWSKIGLAMVMQLFIATMASGQQLDSSRLSGKVVDASGAAIAGATVWVNRAEGPWNIQDEGCKTKTDDDGKYELTLRYTQGASMKVCEVFAEMEGFARAAPAVEIQLENGNSPTLELTLHNGEVLAGSLDLPLHPRERTLPEEKRKKLTRVLEVVGPKTADLPLNGRCYLVPAAGKFRIYVPAGEYTLRVHGYDIDPPEWTGIKTGQTDLVLRIPEFEWSEASLGKAFDQFWSAMDWRYSYFGIKDGVDWTALRDKYRPQAVKAKDAAELAGVLKEMLAPLRDIHIWIETPSAVIPTFVSSYNFNGNVDVTVSQLEDRVECGRFAMVGKTKPDGFGYFLMRRQGSATAADVKTAIEAIKKLHDVPGFVVDLRRASGGSEPLALDIAREFCAKDIVYAKHKYRAGPKHDEFGSVQERILPAGSEPYTKPVVCLIGPGAVSSGEGFVKMLKCLPNVTTVGLPTRGASGNPKPWTVSRTGLTVYFSTWVDQMPDGQSFEGIGIPPDVTVETPKEAYSAADPTLEKGLDILRNKIRAQQGAGQ